MKRQLLFTLGLCMSITGILILKAVNPRAAAYRAAEAQKKAVAAQNRAAKQAAKANLTAALQYQASNPQRKAIEAQIAALKTARINLSGTQASAQASAKASAAALVTNPTMPAMQAASSQNLATSLNQQLIGIDKQIATLTAQDQALAQQDQQKVANLQAQVNALR